MQDPKDMFRPDLEAEVLRSRALIKRLKNPEGVIGKEDPEDDVLRTRLRELRDNEEKEPFHEWEGKFTDSILEFDVPLTSKQRFHVKKILHLYKDPKKRGYQYGKQEA